MNTAGAEHGIREDAWAKPEDDCVLCPDCQGRGLHIERLPLLKADVGFFLIIRGSAKGIAFYCRQHFTFYFFCKGSLRRISAGHGGRSLSGLPRFALLTPASAILAPSAAMFSQRSLSRVKETCKRYDG